MTRIPRGAPRVIGLISIVGIVLMACGRGGPAPVTYVLGPLATAEDRVEPLGGRPLVELKPVLLPDYMDVSEIMVRHPGNVVAPSPTGRWGERLSVGVTRALALYLQRQLPGMVVVSSAAGTDQPVFQILVVLEAFEAQADGRVVLVARWQLVNSADHSVSAPERVSVTELAVNATDAAIAASINRAVEQISIPIAANIRTALRLKSTKLTRSTHKQTERERQ